MVTGNVMYPIFPPAPTSTGSARSASGATASHPLNDSVELSSAAQSALISPALRLVAAAPLFRPAAEWSGRLILPSEDRRRADGGVYIQIENAPPRHASLKGKTLWLSYADDPALQDRVRKVTTDIRFDDSTQKSIAKGNVHPVRLDGRKSVSPLESLAGGRAVDDVQVMLKSVEVVPDGETGLALRTPSEPVQISGSEEALVKAVGPGDRGPGSIRVRHYSRNTGGFDGPEETILLEKPAANANPLIEAEHIGEFSLNDGGWYAYGRHDEQGTFVAQAFEPRALMQVKATELKGDLPSSRRFIHRESWNGTDKAKGTISSALLNPFGTLDGAGSQEFRPGERYVVMHLFGGAGGEGGDNKGTMGLVTGHFSFGTAQVVEDPFTGEPRFDIEYRQVYAHGPQGILSGASKWHDYMGNLSRGWMYVRPVSDTVVKFPAADYGFNVAGGKISFNDILVEELEKMSARYRTGDGDGASPVTPTASCVQDSSQALYAALRRFEKLTKGDAAFMDQVHGNPYSEASINYGRIAKLTSSLMGVVRPLGLARPDWRAYAESGRASAGLGGPLGAAIDAALSWKTVLPRYANDIMADDLLSAGATLWVLRSNAVGGVKETIVPLAPTYPFSSK